MIPMLLLLLSVGFDFYYQYLEREKLRLIRTGNPGDRLRWVGLKRLTEELKPFVGFMRFMDPLICLLVTQSLLGHEYSWPMYAGALVVGLVVSYYKLLYYFKMVFKAIFVKSPNPHHNTKWLLRVAYSSVRSTFAREYLTSHAFVRLAARLLICNTVGHRWNNWEAVKYGNFGSSRMCKACLVHQNNLNGVYRFSETHGSEWKGIVDPDAVFRRKYTGPKS